MFQIDGNSYLTLVFWPATFDIAGVGDYESRGVNGRHSGTDRHNSSPKEFRSHGFAALVWSVVAASYSTGLLVE